MNRHVEPAAGIVSAGARVALVERLWQAAEAQVRAHEARLKALPPDDLATEAHAKALATLARTIKELIDTHAAALEAERAETESAADEPGPDAAMENLATLRAELARRMGLADPAGQGEVAGKADRKGA
jgi:hypothetical protein